MNQRTYRITIVSTVLATWLLLTIPAFVYQYSYPGSGEDTVFWMQYMDTFTLIGHAGHRASILYYLLGILPLDNTVTVLVWNYLVLGLIITSVAIFTRYTFGRLSSILSVPIVILSSFSVLRLWDTGTLPHLSNFMIGLLALLPLLAYLRTGKKKLLIVSAALYFFCAQFHSSSGIATYVSTLLGLGLLMCYEIFFNQTRSVVRTKMKMRFLRRIVIIALVIIIVAPVGTRLLDKYVPIIQANIESARTGEVVEPKIIDASGSMQLTHALAVVGGKDYSSSIKPHDVRDFINLHFGIGTLSILICSVFIIARLKLKVPMQDLTILLGYVIIASIGSFTTLTWNPIRFSFDLGIVLAIITAGLAGIAVKGILDRSGKRIAMGMFTALIVLGLFTGLPYIVGNWFTHTSMIKPADRLAIEYVKGLEGERITISNQIYPDIYEELAYKIIDNESPDYLIFRSEPLSYLTQKGYIHSIVEDVDYDTEEDFSEFTELQRFNGKDFYIVIYEVNIV